MSFMVRRAYKRRLVVRPWFRVANAAFYSIWMKLSLKNSASGGPAP
jgi:hypothetical protein